METKALALLDFDGTLCPGDSVVPFMRYCIARGIAPKRQLFIAAAAYLRFVTGLDAVENVKSATYSFLKGRSVAELAGPAAAFVRERLLPACHAEGIRFARKCREEGLTVVVVSASADLYMRHLPEVFPADAVIATTCEVQEGRYTGLVCKNCSDEEKVNRIRSFLQERDWLLDEKHSLAVGNSASDLPMLRMVRRRFLTGAGRKLCASCPEAEILDWK